MIYSSRQRRSARSVFALTLAVLLAGGGEAPAAASETKLLASDGEAYDMFGSTVSMSRDTALVGSPDDDDAGEQAGAAYVFVRRDGQWYQQAKLLANDTAAYDSFGASVSISGDRALIGAPGDDDNGFDSGSAYVFVRSGESWFEQAKLKPKDGERFVRFGSSVSISGTTAAIGVPLDSPIAAYSGSAYAFTETGGAWTEEVKLIPANGRSNDKFGYAVAASGTTVLIGAWGHDHDLDASGAAYVYVRSGGSWPLEARLRASDPERFALFGRAVSLRGNDALIGAPGTENDKGSAYVFRREAGTWLEQAKLEASDGFQFEYFGEAVAIDDDVAVIGAPRHDAGVWANQGAAYVFVGDQGVWVEETKLLPTDPGTFDDLGRSVSVVGSTALAGAPGDDDNGEDSGSAYVFEEATSRLALAASGSCPGAATVTISNGPPNAEVGVIAAQTLNGWIKGGTKCNGTKFTIGELFQLPPVWVQTDSEGNGVGNMTLDLYFCFLEAIDLSSCETSNFVRLP